MAFYPLCAETAPFVDSRQRMIGYFDLSLIPPLFGLKKAQSVGAGSLIFII
jgi:hypothetical protein